MRRYSASAIPLPPPLGARPTQAYDPWSSMLRQTPTAAAARATPWRQLNIRAFADQSAIALQGPPGKHPGSRQPIIHEGHAHLCTRLLTLNSLFPETADTPTSRL